MGKPVYSPASRVLARNHSALHSKLCDQLLYVFLMISSEIWIYPSSHPAFDLLQHTLLSLKYAKIMEMIDGAWMYESVHGSYQVI